ncbi:fumarylacetoacetate hydrolase family protein [Orrella marina]|uniref:2-keto-4-pentenoate hydratase n=1 Tax=Orrella marina TaxID=2163011 RepID=A0A2R4XHV5_9BURK|nr:fumarylacetoacetate hydrolase family protein [Orrella marina]AWB33397.1 2-keto-4-pentenoate hydratase [Orrella marina]
MAGIDTLVDALVAARARHEPCDQLLLDGTLVTVADSYAVQKQVAQRMGWLTTPCPAYWKSGGPSREAVLTHAMLPESGVWESPASASADLFFTPEIEAEIALRLAEDVTPESAQKLESGVTDHLVDSMTVSIEVVDSRWRQGRTVSALYALADMQSHGALVLGEWVPYIRRDWSAQTCSVKIGQRKAAIFTGTHPLQDPLWGLAQWLRHATSQFGTVPAGTVVTTGTWCGLLPVSAGQAVQVEFAGVGQSSLQL